MNSQTLHYFEKPNLWFPSWDTKAELVIDYQQKRLNDIYVSAGFCHKSSVCVQAGGHVGMWPQRLATIFDLVYSFEPDVDLYECLCQNTRLHKNVRQFNIALGPRLSKVPFERCTTGAGRSKVVEDSPIQVWQQPIDTLMLKQCDLIVLDVEGYELEVLRGAQYTLHVFHPVLHLEINNTGSQSDRDLRAFLTSMGYQEVANVHSDYIFTFR